MELNLLEISEMFLITELSGACATIRRSDPPGFLEPFSFRNSGSGNPVILP